MREREEEKTKIYFYERKTIKDKRIIKYNILMFVLCMTLNFVYASNRFFTNLCTPHKSRMRIS